MPGVVGVGDVLTVHSSPDQITVMMNVDFDDDIRAGEVERVGLPDRGGSAASAGPRCAGCSFGRCKAPRAAADALIDKEMQREGLLRQYREADGRERGFPPRALHRPQLQLVLMTLPPGCDIGGGGASRTATSSSASRRATASSKIDGVENSGRGRFRGDRPGRARATMSSTPAARRCGSTPSTARPSTRTASCKRPGKRPKPATMTRSGTARPRNSRHGPVDARRLRPAERVDPDQRQRRAEAARRGGRVGVRQRLHARRRRVGGPARPQGQARLPRPPSRPAVRRRQGDRDGRRPDPRGADPAALRHARRQRHGARASMSG